MTARPVTMRLPRLPAAPLLEAIDVHCASHGASRARVLGEDGRKCCWRIQANGTVAPSVARRLCDLIGRDPGEVYGDAWQESTTRHPFGDRRQVTPRPRLASAPLVEAIEARLQRLTGQLLSLTDLGTVRGEAIRYAFGDNEGLQRAFYRARRRGWVLLAAADQLCDAFGWHPRELWGEAYDQAAFAGKPAGFDPWEAA